MHAPAAQLYTSGSKISKFAVVALLHLGLIGGLMSMKVLVTPAPPKPALAVFAHPPTPAKPIPIDPPTFIETPPPQISIPQMPVVDTAPPAGPTITVDEGVPVRLEGLPPPVTGGIAGGATQAAPTETRPARVYNAALANANACALPAYPRQALRNGDTGTVTLALLIGPDGKVGASRIARSSGFPELDRAAVAALKLCAFKPATTNGVPESAWGQIAYVWTLDK